MKKLSVFEMASVKRTAKNVSMQRRKKAKLEEKIAALQAELDLVNTVIDSFEAPIIALSGGFTSEEILNGAAEVLEGEASQNEVDEEAVVEEVEVPAEQAVAIDPSVVSPIASEIEDSFFNN